MIGALAIVVGGALAIIALERWRPYDRQRFWRRGLWVDLIGYAVIQSAVLSIAIDAAVRWLDGAIGTRWVTGWSFAGQLAFFVVTHDLYIYWFHRAQHRFGWLWRLHEAHHSAREVDWIAGARSHALEIAINQTIEVAAMVLLGASPEVMLAKGAISVVSGMWIHANVRLSLGPLAWLINGPAQHRWHHAIDFAPPGKNFATKLALWDHLFGTAEARPGKPAGYGLADGFPDGFLAQQAHAFRRPDRPG